MQILLGHYTLATKGAEIAYSDPYLPTFPKMRKHHFDMASVQITPKTLAHYDFVLVATNHDAFNYALIKRHGNLVVDSQGAYTDPADNVVKA